MSFLIQKLIKYRRGETADFAGRPGVRFWHGFAVRSAACMDARRKAVAMVKRKLIGKDGGAFLVCGVSI